MVQKSINDSVRFTSSSGGMFTVFAEQVLNSGGVVFGAAFDGSLQVCHTAVSTMQELTKLRGSKYVQSNMNGIFKQVRTLLAGGKKCSVQRYALPDCRAEGFLMKDYAIY